MILPEENLLRMPTGRNSPLPGDSSLCDTRALLILLAVASVLFLGTWGGAQARCLNENESGDVFLLGPRDPVPTLQRIQPMEASPTDAALVARARRGDAEAFETLVRRHLRAAHALALSVLRNPADADDVCQDVFLSALSKIEQCKHPERFRSWLLAIVRNRALGWRSYEAVRASSSLETVRELASRDDAARDLERRELREDLAVALEDLTNLQRRVVVLHDLEGWTHREIAQELGISLGSSRVHLHNARRALRSRLPNRHLKEA